MRLDGGASSAWVSINMVAVRGLVAIAGVQYDQAYRLRRRSEGLR